MTVTEILGKAPMTLSEVKSELEKIQKRDGDLTFRGNKTLEYVQQLAPLGPKKAKELTKKIQDLNIPRLKEEHIAKLIDLKPKTGDEVKMVLQAFTLTLKDDAAKKLADTISTY